MGVMDWFRGNVVRDYDSQPTISRLSLDELERDYELLDVDDNGVIYASPKGVVALREAADDPLEVTPQEATSGEISGSGATRWRRARNDDYNPLLSGNMAIDQYREMKNDAIVRSSMRIAKTPILSARWFMEPASQDGADKEKANFIWKNLTEWMSISWPQFLIECLYMLDYGVYTFEKVFDFREYEGEQVVYWKKFAPRHPYEISEFIYDEEGGPESIAIDTDEGDVELPIWKALIFTYDKEGGDLWGHSALRSAYKHWFFKEQLYKIDAIQKERHGIGIPVVVLPPNFKGNDKIIAEKIGTNLRTNESAHVVLPPGWEVHFLKLEGQRVDALESAQHHAEKLYENVLANFMMQTNAAGNAEIQEHVFTRAVRFTAEIIRDVINHYAIPQLCRLNWEEDEFENGFPQLKVRRLGDERDWRTLSFAIRNLVGAEVIYPDDELEKWAREEMDMPFMDVATARNPNDDEAADSEDPAERAEDKAARQPTGGTPRDPHVGTPRQSNLPQSGTGSSRVGQDSSGG